MIFHRLGAFLALTCARGAAVEAASKPNILFIMVSAAPPVPDRSPKPNLFHIELLYMPVSTASQHRRGQALAGLGPRVRMPAA